MVDATGKYVLPGCVDPHTHLDMPFGGTVTIDDVESGQTAAAFGGTTCHVDFVIQPKGATFGRRSTSGRRRPGKQVIDMGYHMAVTDLREGGTLEELASLPDQGVTSYKLFMAYKGALMVDDETLFKTMEVAAETGALVMVHAENGDAIDVLVRQALEAGEDRAEVPRADPPARDRGRGDEPGDPALPRGGERALRRPRLLRARPSSRSRSRARRAGTSGARPARSTSSSTTRSSSGRISRARSTSTRRPRGTRRTRTSSGTPCATTSLGDLDRPLRLHLGRAEDARPGRLLEDPERRARPREPPPHDPRVRRPRRDGSRSTGWSSSSLRTRRSSSASIRARAPWRSDRTPTSSSSIRPRSTRSRPRTSTQGSTTTCTRAPRSRDRRSSSFCAETSSSKATARRRAGYRPVRAPGEIRRAARTRGGRRGRLEAGHGAGRACRRPARAREGTPDSASNIPRITPSPERVETRSHRPAARAAAKGESWVG